MHISLSHYQPLPTTWRINHKSNQVNRPFFNFDPATIPTNSAMHGVGIYVSEKLLCYEVSFDNSDFDEQVWVKVVLKGSDSLLIGCIYCSPSPNIYQSTLALCNLYPI